MIKYYLLFFLCTIFFSNAFGQKKDTCKNFSINEFYTPKDTFQLQEHGIVYYLNDCDSIYCILEQPFQRFILQSIASNMASLYYRLGFQFIKEFPNSILFQHSCPAMGTCEYSLVSKDFGLIYQDFDALIYDGKTDTTNFVIYFSNDNYIVVYDIETNVEQKFMYPSNRFNSPFPEYQFTKIDFVNNHFILNYNYLDKKGNKQFDKIDLALKKN